MPVKSVDFFINVTVEEGALDPSSVLRQLELHAQELWPAEVSSWFGAGGGARRLSAGEMLRFFFRLVFADEAEWNRTQEDLEQLDVDAFVRAALPQQEGEYINFTAGLGPPSSSERSVRWLPASWGPCEVSSRWQRFRRCGGDGLFEGQERRALECLDVDSSGTLDSAFCRFLAPPATSRLCAAPGVGTWMCDRRFTDARYSVSSTTGKFILRGFNLTSMGPIELQELEAAVLAAAVAAVGREEVIMSKFEADVAANMVRGEWLLVLAASSNSLVDSSSTVWSALAPATWTELKPAVEAAGLTWPQDAEVAIEPSAGGDPAELGHLVTGRSPCKCDAGAAGPAVTLSWCATTGAEPRAVPEAWCSAEYCSSPTCTQEPATSTSSCMCGAARTSSTAAAKRASATSTTKVTTVTTTTTTMTLPAITLAEPTGDGAAAAVSEAGVAAAVGISLPLVVLCFGGVVAVYTIRRFRRKPSNYSNAEVTTAATPDDPAAAEAAAVAAAAANDGVGVVAAPACQRGASSSRNGHSGSSNSSVELEVSGDEEIRVHVDGVDEATVEDGRRRLIDMHQKHKPNGLADGKKLVGKHKDEEHILYDKRCRQYKGEDRQGGMPWTAVYLQVAQQGFSPEPSEQPLAAEDQCGSDWVAPRGPSPAPSERPLAAEGTDGVPPLASLDGPLAIQEHTGSHWVHNGPKPRLLEAL